MKSKFKWEFLGPWPHGDSYRVTWRTYSKPQYIITGTFSADGTPTFDVYRARGELVEHGWSTLRRAQKFVDRYERDGELVAYRDGLAPRR